MKRDSMSFKSRGFKEIRNMDRRLSDRSDTDPSNTHNKVAPITYELAHFASTLQFGNIPAQAVAIAKTGFVDCVATMLAGSKELVAQVLMNAIGDARGESSVLFNGSGMHPANAAWINGTAAHALDYDDAALRGHPSAVLVPAILAECQALNRTGADAIQAYVAGYEVWAELAHRDSDHHHNKGWHPTGIFGSIAAAAACASLHRLTPEQTANALAIAASRSGGIMANFGSMTKPFHAGSASHAGVVAARVASLNMTGSPDALEHPQGFLSAVSPNGVVDKQTSVHANRALHLLHYGLNLKKYPMCYCTHRPIDAMIGLRKKHQWAGEQIKKIIVSLSARNATVLRNHRPKSGLEGKFSIEFAMAAAVVAAKVGLTEVTDDFVLMPQVQALIPRVVVLICDEQDPESGYAPYDYVIVQLADGTEIRSENVRDARGAHCIPLTTNERFEKFADCAKVAGLESAPELFTLLEGLERVADLTPLGRTRFVAKR
jgi:2-methylcitrate dehydratase PrpD